MKHLLLIPALLAACTQGPAMTPIPTKGGTPIWAVDPVVVRPSGARRILEATDGEYVPVVRAVQPEAKAPAKVKPSKPVTPKAKPALDCDGAASCEPDSKADPVAYGRWREAFVRNGGV